MSGKSDKTPKRLFGTDGIRGLANEFPMSSEIVMNVGRAVAHALRNHPELCSPSSIPIGLTPIENRGASRRAKVVVGKDTRLANYMIENALVSGLCSMGVDVLLIGPLPTPGVAFVTKSMRADAGIMISASHNPYQDTGIKIFGANGYKLPDEVEREIEALVESDELKKNRPTGDEIGKAFRIDDAIGRYLVHLKAHFPKDLDLQGLRIVLDCANGAAYKVAPLVFSELGAEIIAIGTDPNGLNINHHCGALHADSVGSAVVEYRADLGIALDGDGDRCILADETGKIVDGDHIIGLCAIEMQQKKELAKETVVTTPMSNIGLENTLKDYGINMVRAKVGDRYVVDEMRKNGYNLGGEQSGHIVFLDDATTGDGIVGSLKVLELMKRTNKQLSKLRSEIKLYPQVLENVKVTKKEPFEKFANIKSAISEAEKTLAEKGRVFVRYSGTEPLARIMVEGENSEEIHRLSQNIANAIRKELG